MDYICVRNLLDKHNKPTGYYTRVFVADEYKRERTPKRLFAKYETFTRWRRLCIEKKDLCNYPLIENSTIDSWKFIAFSGETIDIDYLASTYFMLSRNNK